MVVCITYCCNRVPSFLFFSLPFLMDSSFRSRYLSSVCRVLILDMGGSGMCGVVHDKLALDLGLTHLTFP